MPESLDAEYASFDPGKITGWCLWALVDNKAMLLNKGQADKDELIDLLETEPFKNVHTVITEDFVLFSWKAKQQAGKTMPAPEIIGVIESYVRRGKRRHIKQPSNILPIAEKITQVKMPKNHSVGHWVSAFLHGAYFFVKEGKYETPLAKQTQDKGTKTQ
jgi:hypothetical protein